MKVVSIVGARPQFIKAGPVSRELRRRHVDVLVHSGQHFDEEMSAVFFDELELPRPDHHLGVGSGTHGRQTGQMLMRIEQVLLEEAPDWVVVYGDTNTTLAGALAASKLQIAVAHVEAGLRSFNRAMPEEQNRRVVDHLSERLLCPSRAAVSNLAAEGIEHGVHLVGDVMADLLFSAVDRADSSTILDRLGVQPAGYLLATVHRAENTDDEAALRSILRALDALDEPVVFPMHPRTQQAARRIDWTPAAHVQRIAPVGYLDMVQLERRARMILTDSGGVQKEAYWLGVPCVTLREETEWVETVQLSWNRLAGTSTDKIVETVRTFRPPAERPPLYGDGCAAVRCVDALDTSASR